MSDGERTGWETATDSLLGACFNYRAHEQARRIRETGRTSPWIERWYLVPLRREIRRRVLARREAR